MLRWVPTENLHVTLKFLGPVAETKITSVTDALAKSLSGQATLSVAVKGLGVFPNLEGARILWAGLSSGTLRPLVERIENGLEPLGFEKEQRPFRAHLTLGRWRFPEQDPSCIRLALEGRNNDHFGEFTVNDVNLLQSTLHPKGAVYSVLKSFQLERSRAF